MRVLLFNSCYISSIGPSEQYIVYPRCSIASMASVLMENGVDVEIIDPQAYRLSVQEVMSEVKHFSPDIVGIPAYTEEIHDADYLASCVKQIDQKTITVVGGAHPSAMPIETLNEFKSFDIAVIREGERTFLEIAEGRELRDVKGIAYREKGCVKLNEQRPLIESLDSLPFPAWQLYKLNSFRLARSDLTGKRNILPLPVEAARGCPFGCIFCYRIAGRTIRFKSPSRVVDEIERNVKEFHVDEIHMNEGTFGVSKEQVRGICKELQERRLDNIAWGVASRTDVMSRELLSEMKNAGCRYVGFGVESGCPEILCRIGKSTDLSKTENVFRDCKELGIETAGYFIIGLPFETEETVTQTIKFAKKLETKNANFAILVPFPQTEVWEMAQRGEGGLKLKTRSWKMYGKQMGASLELEQLPTERLYKLQKRAYVSFYSKPSRLINYLLTASKAKNTSRTQALKFLFSSTRARVETISERVRRLAC